MDLCLSCFWVQALAIITKHGRNISTTTISTIPAAVFSVQKIITNGITQHEVEKSIPAWIWNIFWSARFDLMIWIPRIHLVQELSKEVSVSGSYSGFKHWHFWQYSSLTLFLQQSPPSQEQSYKILSMFGTYLATVCLQWNFTSLLLMSSQ